MRRFVLSAAVVLAVATTAGAVVQGYPDAVYITSWSVTGGTFSVDNVPGSSSWTASPGTPLDVTATMGGISDGIGTGFQWSAGTTRGAVTVEARYNSPQSGFGAGEIPNFLIYLGDSVAGSAVSVGSVTFAQIAYDVTGTLTWVQSRVPASYTPPPDIWSASLAPIDYGFSFPGAVGLVYAIQIQFTVASPTTFYIDALQNPEPGTLALFGLGVCGLGCVVARRRRRCKKA